MKRFVIAILAVLCLVPSLVQAKGLMPDQRSLYFRTSVANGSATPTLVDSAYTLRGSGIVSSAENADTTATFSPIDWTMPGIPQNSTVSDTISWLRVVVVPEGTTPTVTADTLGIQLQLSDDDGTTWTTTTWTGPRIDLDVSNSTQAAALETGTTNGFAFTLRQTSGGVTLGGPFFSLNTGPTANQAYGYRLARFIFVGDHTGKYVCKLIGFHNTVGDD